MSGGIQQCTNISFATPCHIYDQHTWQYKLIPHLVFFSLRYQFHLRVSVNILSFNQTDLRNFVSF